MSCFQGVNTVDYFHGGEKPYLISGADDRLVKIWDYQVYTNKFIRNTSYTLYTLVLCNFNCLFYNKMCTCADIVEICVLLHFINI